MESEFNKLLKRTITGILFVAVMVGAITWNIWSCIGLFAVISLLGLWEFYLLVEKKTKGAQKVPGMVLGVMLIAASAGKYFAQVQDISNHSLFLLSIILFPVFLISKLFRKTELIQSFSPTLFGILYIVLPFCCLILFYSPSGDNFRNENNMRIILGFFFLIWANDTFSYLTGTAIGKHKLFERISPQKTWEGTIGGIILTQATAYLLSLYFTELAGIHWMVVALITSVFGTLGDLIESMLKRNMNVKDSGNILPGHGGILDRFDGALLAAPFVVAYLMLIR